MRRILLVVLFMATSAYATTVQRLGLEDLVKRAHTIVVGRVTNSRTYWTPDRKLILTNYTIQVDENMKGATSKTMEVTTIGGKLGDVELHVSGMPSFQQGESAVVFIEQANGYQVVLGLEQGKFTVANGEVTNRVAGLSFPDGRPGAAMRMPLQTFKSQIRNILNK